VGDLLGLVLAVLVLTVVTAVALVSGRGSRRPLRSPSASSTKVGAPRPGVDYRPGTGDDAEVPRDTPLRSVEVVDLPEDAALLEAGTQVVGPVLEVPEPTAGRLHRLRARLSRSQTTLGRGLFTLLSRDVLDEDTWEEVEDTLLAADMGVTATTELVTRLRTRVRVDGVRSLSELRPLLREELVRSIGADADRTLRTLPHEDGTPAVVLVVGVNGTGKTTTCGKLARVLVADGRSVVLGAADTFRAAAADQLQTWGDRVGAQTVRGPEGGDPASVAFDAVAKGRQDGVDTVLIDTAGRLHTKTGLMDELGKVKRVVEKHGPVDETLLVLDATTGQNGVVQARVFTQAVTVTGIVLTKLDGTAKGGIVVAVQRELGIPVKLIGLGEGPDDLAPFEPEAFADALLGDEIAL
jgi:fused signal recognition particle receptor